MFPAMSRLLQTTQRPSIDTSFKRADSYEEFELEAWFPEHMKCMRLTTLPVPHAHLPCTAVVCTRAFITSQSAAAHKYLFQRIFSIVEHDTGQPVHFRHIHGVGFETIVADAHKGQALGKLSVVIQETRHSLCTGLGQLCASLSQNIAHTCSYPCACELRALTPYEHLKHFFMLCVNHFQRGIHKLGNDVSPEVRAAMHSLVSAYPLPDLQRTKELIHSGGPRAAGAYLLFGICQSPFTHYI
jgi:hypothetical protein